jgi:hypothetical protein
LRSVGEGSTEGVTLGTKDVTSITLYGLPTDSIMTLDGKLHSLRVVLPTSGASLYIGEQEGDSAG